VQTITRRRALAPALALGALALTGIALAAARPGAYSGVTSEKSTVSFTLEATGKAVTGFAATDGYNDKCRFKGGVGGIPNFPVKVRRMSVAANGAFAGTAKSKLGPFTATIKVSGKLTGSTAKGTITKVGATCGTGSPTPKAASYLETFTARKR
jgi:hypothetical protein